MKKFRTLPVYTLLLGLSLWLSSCNSSNKHLEEGRKLLGENKINEAITALNEAVSADAGNAQALNARGVAYYQLKDYSNALLDYEQAMKADSSLYLPYFNRAKLRIAQNDFESAIKDFSKAATLAPDSAEIYLNRGFVYAELKLPQKATPDFDKAVQLAPKNAETYFVRGNLYLEQKNYPSAIRDYEQAVGLRSDFPKAFYNMGLAQNLVGNREAACLSFQQAKKLGYAEAADAVATFCK
ncbi:tetratricopeptide repeat protein [Siphonobacter curvatus]|uniref:Uncharacterized protein n=1 Tax=Siphonobacter curvatus TaxID=2094562 RepID=A0A2S7IMP2_9BACT|nr:tetratricopeptide repeat protein [Siphonobacter curvatus]PQA59011.1 hypothetical protein C5O19_04970 [Siphonobacter curvatus]